MKLYTLLPMAILISAQAVAAEEVQPGTESLNYSATLSATVLPGSTTTLSDTTTTVMPSIDKVEEYIPSPDQSAPTAQPTR